MQSANHGRNISDRKKVGSTVRRRDLERVPGYKCTAQLKAILSPIAMANLANIRAINLF